MSMLAGLGRGLQNFSTILGDHEKMNRAEQQRQLDYERQQHLADLMHRRQVALQESSQKFQGEQNLQQRNLTQQQITQTGKHQDKQIEIAQGTYDMQKADHENKQVAVDQDGNPVTNAQLAGMSEEQKKTLITPEQHKYNFSIKLLEETNRVQGKLDKEQADAAIAEMAASGILDGLTDMEKRLVKLSVTNPKAGEMYGKLLEAQAKTGIKMEDQVNILKELNDVPVTKENLEYVNSLRARVGLGKMEVGEEALPGVWNMLRGNTEEVIRPAGGQLKGAGAQTTTTVDPNKTKVAADAFVYGSAKNTGMGATAAAGAKNLGSAAANVAGRHMDPESPAVIEREIKATPEYREATKNMAPLAEKNYLANRVQEEIVMRKEGPQQPGETEVGYQQRIEEAMKNAGIRYTGARK